MSSVLLLQCLCPARHCIMAFAGEAPPETPAGMAEQARFGIEGAIRNKAINPYCALCQAPRDQWTFEIAELPGKTLAEVMPALKTQEADQIATLARIKAEERAARN